MSDFDEMKSNIDGAIKEIREKTPIVNMQNYIRKRQRKGKAATEIRQDLMDCGYDWHAASGLIMLHWEREDSPHIPIGGD